MQSLRARTFLTLTLSSLAFSGCGDTPEPTTPIANAPAYAAFAVGNSGNSDPRAWISTPTHKATVAQGKYIAFTGNGRDAEDGTLTGASLVWTTNLDGQIGTGESFSSNRLSAGEHVLTLTATDSHGASFSHNRIITITPTVNEAPRSQIVEPQHGASFVQGTSTAFAGSASDPEDGELTGSSLVWNSDRDGQIGIGASFSHTALSVGEHIISLTATDSRGGTYTHHRTITVASAPNQAPTALISTPLHGSSHPQGISILFSGSGSDPEDGSLSGSSLVWRSDRDGQLGTGASFSRSNLSAGDHLISLTATDSRGATYTHYRMISVSALQKLVSVASVTVTLASSSLLVGGTTTATAVVRDAAGVVLTDRVISWTSSNTSVATVSSSGLLTAVGAGSASITATVDGVTGSAAISVTAPTTTSSGSGPEPSGMTTVLDNSPEASVWVKTGTAAARSESSAPRSASTVVRVTFPTGFVGGSAAGGFYPTGANYNSRTAYYETWMRVSDNFQGHSTGINKLVHFFVCGSNRLLLQGYGDGLTTTLSFQGIALPYQWGQGNRIGTSGHLTPNQGRSAAFVRGRWHHVQILMVANTPGQADGEITLWFDGQKVTHNKGIGFCASGTNGLWEEVKHSPTWGGLGDVVVSPFYVEWDHVRMSRK